MLHKLKIKKQFADAIVAGDKLFEVRRNDRAYQTGDTVEFDAYNNSDQKITHTINCKVYKISYLLSGWGIEPGYVAFGIREVSDGNND